MGVIGGGIAGLTLAALLAQRGRAVTVYEATEPGGKLRRFSHAGLSFDTGPSLFTFPGVWRRVLARLGESDPLDLRPLPGGLGVHHTPFGSLPLPVPEGHPLFSHWRRYLREVAPLLPHVETLLTTSPRLNTPPHLNSAAFLRASSALGRVTFPHLNAESWLRSRRFPPALHHALAVHSLNAGLGPGQGSVLYALLPALMAGEVSRPAPGMGALLDALLALCASRGVEVRENSPVTDLRRLDHHHTLVSALDPSRLAGLLDRRLLGKRAPDAPLTVSGVALYARLPSHLIGALPATSVVTPSSYPQFAAAMSARALPLDTLALVHADGERLALLLTAPPTGQRYALEHPWVQAQIGRVEQRLGVSGLLAGGALALTPGYFAEGGATGGAIYGRAWPSWRGGPFHPERYRLSERLWQVGTGVHPGGGLPAVMGGALIVDELLARR